MISRMLMNPLIGNQYAMVRSLNTVTDDPHSVPH